MLLFGLILMMAATAFLGLTRQSGRFQEQARAQHLAHNLMETLLALPPAKAKALHPENLPEWTDNRHYTVTVTWEPYRDPHFEKLSVAYADNQQPLIHLVTLVSNP